MKESTTIKGKVCELLRVNKFVVILEIILVFVPIFAGLFISNKLGSNHTSLRNVVLLGGPLAYLGLLISLFIIWRVSIMRNISWSYFGLARPKSLFLTLLLGIGVSLAIIIASLFMIYLLKNFFPDIESGDMSRFDILNNNLLNLIINIVAMWFTTAFVEELLFRGYLMNRLANLLNKTKGAWTFALISNAIIFGLLHSSQGITMVIETGLSGFLFGVAFLLIKRRLWPLIIAHGIIDTIAFLSFF
jgi:membrane protease YdiL (CAAX protease family)